MRSCECGDCLVTGLIFAAFVPVESWDFWVCVQAGSDSLLTSSAFVTLESSRFKGFEQLQGHKGVLFGLGVDGNNEMVLTDH